MNGMLWMECDEQNVMSRMQWMEWNLGSKMKGMRLMEGNELNEMNWTQWMEWDDLNVMSMMYLKVYNE